jgi:GxxExxY protein
VEGIRHDQIIETDDLTGRIIGCAIEVHRQLGPGLLESMYEAALAIELEFAGIRFERQVGVPIQYRSKMIGSTGSISSWRKPLL